MKHRMLSLEDISIFLKEESSKAYLDITTYGTILGSSKSLGIPKANLGT